MIKIKFDNSFYDDEINPDQVYFLTEAEQIVGKISRYENLQFEVIEDGTRTPLILQEGEIIKSLKTDKQIKHYKKVIQEELTVFEDEVFYTFATRLNALLPGNLYSIKDYLTLYESLKNELSYPLVSRLEDVLQIAQSCFFKINGASSIYSINDLLVYTLASCNSISLQRLEVVRNQSKIYHELQDILFNLKNNKFNFFQSLSLNEQIHKEIQNKYNHLLQQGISLQNDSVVSKLIIMPIISENIITLKQINFKTNN